MRSPTDPWKQGGIPAVTLAEVVMLGAVQSPVQGNHLAKPKQSVQNNTTTPARVATKNAQGTGK